MWHSLQVVISLTSLGKGGYPKAPSKNSFCSWHLVSLHQIVVDVKDSSISLCHDPLPDGLRIVLY